MVCITENLDLEACINLERDARQDLHYSWLIEGMAVATEFTLSLKNRSLEVEQTYALIPVDGLLSWEVSKEDFTDNLMFYSIVPTAPTPETWIEIKGKITTR